jgi:SAM-dependent methyltransferase
MSWDPQWEQVHQQQAWGRYPSEHVVRFAARRFGAAAPRSDVRILDLGCGAGAHTWLFAREGFQTSAIDGSPTAVSRCRSRLEAENLQAELKIGDAAALPWPDNTFDGVVDNVTLYSNPLEGIRAGIAEVFRVLKPGGWFLSVTFTDRTWGYGTGPQTEPGTFAHITEGPLAHKGVQRFFSRADIDTLYQLFTEHTLERSLFTVGGMAHQIEHWILECRKPRP